MLVYAVVSIETEKAIDVFIRRDDVERFLACRLRLEPVELGA